MIKLGVNLDHVATIRQQRYTPYPDMLTAINIALDNGADSITMHLREDRRHIQIDDIMLAKENIGTILNLEMAATNDMLSLAKSIKPDYVCIVPEKRQEITTEGGLNLKKNFKKIKRIIQKLNNSKIRTSLFIDPNIEDIKFSKKIGTHCVELHTGKLSFKVKNKINYFNELKKIKKCSELANKFNIEVHAGHGMDYKTAKILKKVKFIKEFNIGHFIIGESVLFGMNKVIKNFKKIIR